MSQNSYERKTEKGRKAVASRLSSYICWCYSDIAGIPVILGITKYYKGYKQTQFEPEEEPEIDFDILTVYGYPAPTFLIEKYEALSRTAQNEIHKDAMIAYHQRD